LKLYNLFTPHMLPRLIFTLVLFVALSLLSFKLGGVYTGSKSLRINEVMLDNLSAVADSEGEYPGWFEIHNPSSVQVSLKGYWVSTERSKPFGWPFPDIKIDPDGYLLVFASGKDVYDHKDDSLHTDFTFSSGGCDIYLIDPEARHSANAFFKKPQNKQTG